MAGFNPTTEGELALESSKAGVFRCSGPWVCSKRMEVKLFRIRIGKGEGPVAAIGIAFSLVLSATPTLAQRSPAPPIAYQRRTVLVGAEAQIGGTANLIDMGPGKAGWIEKWNGEGNSLTWAPTVLHGGEYEVSTIIESSGADCSVSVRVNGRAKRTNCGRAGWNRVQVGSVHLSAGQNIIQFSSDGRNPLSKFFSLQFVRPAVRERLAALGEAIRAETKWMVAAKYGLMFHWTSQSMPRHGAPLSYCEAVRRFDVDRFADMVSRTGAGFVVFTTSHAGFYFPGPNSVIDSILPGRTCPRDLVGDLADALSRRHVRLELYFHPGHDDFPWWERSHFEDDKVAYFRQWRAIISSIGNRYGRRLAGWWFDDAAFTYYPYNPDWQQMSAAARAGNPERVIAFNSWVLPKLNEFYDVFAGENASWETKYQDLEFLPIGGTGRYIGGPQKGLQAETNVLLNDDWGHFKPDEPIAPPRFSTRQIVSRITDAIARRAVTLLDIEVYQDGTTSPENLRLLEEVRKAIDSEHR